MRILSARIFSKSFGGKNLNIETDVLKKTTLSKKLIPRNSVITLPEVAKNVKIALKITLSLT